MGRILFLLLLGGAFYYAYTVGIVDSITHDFKPRVGVKCKVAGPFTEDGVWVGESFRTAELLIDSHIGFRSDQLAGAFARAAMKKAGEAFITPNGTKVQVKENKSGRIHGVAFKAVRVLLLDGEYEGAEGWVQREDVIDTPLQEFYQNFRSVAAKNHNAQVPDVQTQE